MVEADVCVVGAGYAGLTAALRLEQRGLNAVLLEARDRVGGRVWTVTLDDGTRVDLGGAWVGDGHDALRSLAAEFGVETFPTFHEGDALLELDGRLNRYRGPAPFRALGIRAVAALAIAMSRVDRMSRKVPADAPWTAPNATKLDARRVRGSTRRYGTVRRTSS